MKMAPLSKPEKLRIAGYVAPRLRGGRSRPIKVVDKDGNVVREIPSAELVERINERAGIELDTDRRSRVRCNICGSWFANPTNRGWHKRATCNRCLATVCAGFGGVACSNGDDGGPEKPTRMALQKYRQRRGRPWRCTKCAGKYLSAVLSTPEKRDARSSAQRARMSKLSPEEKRRIADELLRSRGLSRSDKTCGLCGLEVTHRGRVSRAKETGGRPVCVSCKPLAMGRVGKTGTRNGTRSKIEQLPCSVCGLPATRASCRNAKYRGNMPYCSKHTWGHT